MKKTLLLFVGIFLVLASCSSNQNENLIDSSENKIAGKWEVIDFKSDGITTNTAAGQTASITFSATGKDYDFIFDFQNSPNILEASGSYTTILSQNIGGQIIESEVPTNSIDGFDSGEWSVIDNKLRIISKDSDDNTVVDDAEIIELEDGILKLKFDSYEKIEQVIQGIKSTIEIKINVFLTLKQIESYSNSDNNSDVNIVDDSEVIGKWELIDFNSEGKTTSKALGQTITTEYSSYGKDYNYELEFSENPKYINGSGTYTTVITTITSGQTQTQEIPNTGLDGLDSGIWSINGDMLNITYDSSDDYLESEITFIEFDGETMKLRIDINDTIFDESQGIQHELTIETSIFLTFRKKN